VGAFRPLTWLRRAQAWYEETVSTLRAWVSAGESGPLITLCGEADMTTVAELSELVTAQLTGGTVQLTFDVPELSFADTPSIQVLLPAASTLRKRGGDLPS
jgi:anti-anti-sigma regulatory factor